MNKFIETLKSIGGVEPCVCHGEKVFHDTHESWHKSMEKQLTKNKMAMVAIGDPSQTCPLCHGIGHILDLAPLLAKPKELEECVSDLWTKLSCQHMAELVTDKVLAHQMKVQPTPVTTVFPGNRYIVGPQRAHSLVYEIARQLGGTVMVAEPVAEPFIHDCTDKSTAFKLDIKISDYRLSLPIPDNATVLFVTDRMAEKEMNGVIHCVGGMKVTSLPYILSLVSNIDSVIPESNEDGSAKWEFKIISLHQEKA